MKDRRRLFSIVLLFVVVLIIVFFIVMLTGQTTGDSVFKPTPDEQGAVGLYFCQTGDCEGAMLAAINSSSSVHCAFYDLDLQRLKELLKAKNADVLVFDQNFDGFGTPVANARAGLMHNKFCVLDSRTVITGSMNPTINDAQKNDNNLLIISGDLLAKNYEAEFEELKMGTEKPVLFARINHTDTLSGRSFIIENYFCPEDGCEDHALAALDKATTSIRFMTFSFTSERIGDLLVRKAAAGVNVSGVFETRQESKYSEYTGLRAAGLDVRLDGNANTMHHKVFLIDAGTPQAAVIFGSYNPTANGNERNDENVLIVHDAQIAQAFETEFERVYSEAKSP